MKPFAGAQLAAAVLLVATTLPIWGADMSADAIMDRNFRATRVKVLESSATMLLMGEGSVRERKMTAAAKLQKDGKNSSVITRFDQPADIRGSAFLQIENPDGNDNLWIYLPALKKTRRLVANNRKDSFFGTEFSYGDILSPKVEQYRHTLLRSEALSNEDCYVVESVPRDEEVMRNSGYSKRISWVRKSNFVELQIQYYDLGGQLLKTQRVGELKVVEADTNRWLALRREMVNHQSGRSTIFTLDRTRTDGNLPDIYFTTRTIEQQ